MASRNAEHPATCGSPFEHDGDDAQIAGSVLDRIAKRVDGALQRNRQVEITIAICLSVLFVVGLGLLVASAIVHRFELGVLGGVFELAIAFPINGLVRLRKENLRLQVIPDLIQLADNVGGAKSKELAFQFVMHLIEKV